MNARFVLIYVYVISLILVGSQTNGLANLSDEIIAVQEFVRTIPYHGLDYKKANSFDSSVVPILKVLLHDDEEKRYWPNIITTLAIIGDDKALNGITEFLKKKGTLPEASLKGKTSALYALGIWIQKSIQKGNNTNKHKKVIDTLIDCFRATLPKQTDLKLIAYLKSIVGPNLYTVSLPITNEDQKHQLNRAAVFGLAMSGDAQALDKISTSKSIPKNPIDPDLFIEASRVNQCIKARGLDC